MHTRVHTHTVISTDLITKLFTILLKTKRQIKHLSRFSLRKKKDSENYQVPYSVGKIAHHSFPKQAHRILFCQIRAVVNLNVSYILSKQHLKEVSAVIIADSLFQECISYNIS